MVMLAKVWIWAEKKEDLVRLVAGAGTLGEEVSIILTGNDADPVQGQEAGASKIYHIKGDSAEYMPEDYAPSIARLIKQEKPNLVLIPSGKRGKLIAGRLAAALGTSVVVDAAEIEVAPDSKVQATHMVYGGAALRTEKILTDTAIVTVGAGAFSDAPKKASAQPTVINTEFVQPKNIVKILEKKAKTGATVNLAAAKRVVGIGRGIGRQEDIALAEELAGLLDAELGCSRPLAEGVDWLPRERYIGVSGVMLKPDVYLAIGISGQIQHMVGVNQAKVVIAINKDKNAPIFAQADYGIVGDLYKILPALISKVKVGQ